MTELWSWVRGPTCLAYPVRGVSVVLVLGLFLDCWLQLDNSSTYNTNETSYTSYYASRSVTSACCSTIVFCYLLWNSVTQLFVPKFGSSLLSDLSIDRLIHSLIHSWATLFIHLFTGWLPSVIWHCWLGGRKGIRPVKKTEWWGAGVVSCLQRGADCLLIVQLMPLSSPNPIISCLI